MTRLEDFLKLNKNRQIWTISKDQSVMQALILMSEKNIGAIIIVDNNDFPIGIFSERDYARKIILKGKSSKDTLLDEVMTKELITVTRDYKIDQCMEIMNEKRIRHLPVLEDKKTELNSEIWKMHQEKEAKGLKKIFIFIFLVVVLTYIVKVA